MPEIILCSKGKGGFLKKTIETALSSYGGVLSISADRLFKSCENPLNCFFKTDRIPESLNCFGTIVFDSDFVNSSNQLASDGFVPILETGNTKAVNCLSGFFGQVITCGTGRKDTLSVASIDDNRATISLQREIKDFSGNVIEPHDFNVKSSGSLSKNLYHTLASCAVLLLIGADSSKGYAIGDINTQAQKAGYTV